MEICILLDSCNTIHFISFWRCWSKSHDLVKLVEYYILELLLSRFKLQDFKFIHLTSDPKLVINCNSQSISHSVYMGDRNKMNWFQLWIFPSMSEWTIDSIFLFKRTHRVVTFQKCASLFWTFCFYQKTWTFYSGLIHPYCQNSYTFLSKPF